MEKQLKSVWISDVHLGKYFSQTTHLLEFLKFIQKQNPDKIYIVGDFIDGWKLKKSWYWSDECSLIIRKLLTLVKHGSEIIYIAGNHDEFLRDFIHENHLDFGSIRVCDEAIHECIDGRRLLITHGDKFDTVICCTLKYARWLVHLCDRSYDFLIIVNTIMNFFRKKLGLCYWSLSHAVKKKVKGATNYIGCFEAILAQHAQDKGCDGVVCGHIHSAAIGKIQGIDYYNSGDWVESCTALLEFEDGKIELYYHPQTH